MISVVICSRNKNCLQNLKFNISKTIGVPYEIIVIDNSENDYNIFSAYNEGISLSKGEILCFVHEDVIFKTQEWGKNLELHLCNNEIGLVGIFGSHFMPNCFPIPYWENPCSGSLIHSIMDGNGHSVSELCERYESPQKKANELEVAVIDGVFMAGKKSLFNMIRFDVVSFDGFHCYDLDICMQVHQIEKKVIVVGDVHLIHKSRGNADERFYSQLLIWYTKWKESLPICCGMAIEDLPWTDITLPGYYLRKSEELNVAWRFHHDSIRSMRSGIFSKIKRLLHA